MGIAIRLGERFLRVSERSRRVGILHRAKTRALGALLGQQPTVGRGHNASADRFFRVSTGSSANVRPKLSSLRQSPRGLRCERRSSPSHEQDN